MLYSIIALEKIYEVKKLTCKKSHIKEGIE